MDQHELLTTNPRARAIKNIEAKFPESDLKALFESIPNISIMNDKCDTFEESTVGWVTFTKVLNALLGKSLEFTPDNFKNEYMGLETRPQSVTSLQVDEVSEKALGKSVEDHTTEDLERLIALSPNGEDGEDLIEDIPDEYLTEEGLRSAKFIDRQATSLDAVDFNPVNSQKFVKIRNKWDTIVSPYSGTEEVMMLDNSTYLDLVTGDEFKVYYMSQNV